MELKEKSYPEVHEEEEQGEEERLKRMAAMPSDDDDEANEDLSLKIVKKHLMRRAAKLDLQQDNNKINVVTLNDINKSDGVVVAGPSGISDDVIVEDVKYGKNKSRVFKKEEAEKTETDVQSEEQEVAVVNNGDDEVKAVEIADNIVMRKLLRGPRYFDPPDSGWQTCYNCGEEGHLAVNCTSAVKRKKPCFICGSLEHGVKQCAKAQDCFICKNGGHRAKDCPDKHSQNAQVCLKCGDFGHDMFSCRNSYSLHDLKEVQCYICKSFGHLCCVNVTDAGLKEVSCFRCGQLGHTGLACSRSRGETAEASPSSCYKCGGEGHFARECVSSVKLWARSYGEIAEASPSSCYKCGGEGHFARECVNSAKVRKRNFDTSTPTLRPHREKKDYSGVKSAPHGLDKACKKKKTHHKERGITTPRKSKPRGSWITDDPGDISYREPKRNHWRSPGTPSSKGHKISAVTSGGHFSSSQSSKRRASRNKNSASRFNYSVSDGIRRGYDWW